MLNEKGIQAINQLLMEDAQPNSGNVGLYRTLLDKVEERKDGTALAQTASAIASVIAADAASQIIMTCHKKPADGIKAGASSQDHPVRWRAGGGPRR